MDVALLPAQFENAYLQLQISNYVSIAITALFVYDCFVTLDIEVEYIWSSRWSFGRISFHFNRVWTLFVICATMPVAFGYNTSVQAYVFLSSHRLCTNPRTLRCRNIVLVYGVGVIFVSLNITCIMILRAWVLYDKRKIVLLWMGTACVLVVIVYAIGLYYQFERVVVLPNPAPDIFIGCLTNAAPAETRFPFIAAFVVDTAIFGLFVWRTWVLRREGVSSPIVAHLMKDGMLYYIYHLVALVCVMSGMGLGVLGYLIAVHSILCSRMLLSTRTFEHHENTIYDSEITQRPMPMPSRFGSFAPYSQGNSLIELEDARSFSHDTL